MKLSSQRNIRTLHNEVATAMNKRLNFADQFNSFVAQVTVDAGEEATVLNKLRNKNGDLIVPGSWQVIDARGAGKEALGRGAINEWTKEQLFLENFSVNNGSFSVRFFEKSPDEAPLIAQPNPAAAETPDRTTIVSFSGPNSGTIALNNGTFTTFTVSASEFHIGTDIAVAGDNLTFTYSGKYVSWINIAKINAPSAGSVYVRIRDTSDSVTLAISMSMRANTVQTEPFVYLPFTIAAGKEANNVQVQWAANVADVATVAPPTIDGETGYAWRYLFIREGDV